jgi:type I restriction-modification system DNA methylase subunit
LDILTAITGEINMKITQVVVSLGRTVDVRPYYSRKFDLTLTASLTEADDYQVCQQQLIDELKQKLEQLEYQARQQANSQPQQPTQQPAQPQQQPEQDARHRQQAQREIANLLTNIPRSNSPELSQQITDRLAATFKRHGWQGLDDIKHVASLLLNRSIEEVWDIAEHEAKAIVLWLDKASNDRLDKLWPSF